MITVEEKLVEYYRTILGRSPSDRELEQIRELARNNVIIWTKGKV